MADVFDELNEINSPVVAQDGKINLLNFKLFLDELEKRDPQTIRTAALIDFVSSLGKNKSGSKNSIGRLQYFLNAYSQEIALLHANSNLKFVKDDHEYLKRGNTGTNDADFVLEASNGKNYTIDAKMYGTKKGYFSRLSETNFHDADYALIFTNKETPRWLFSKKSENYETLYTPDELKETDPWLLEINLPTSIRLIYFTFDKDLTDVEVPEEVGYFFINK